MGFVNTPYRIFFQNIAKTYKKSADLRAHASKSHARHRSAVLFSKYLL